MASLGKVSPSAVRRRAAPAKLVVLNEGIVAALAGESARGATLDLLTRSRWLENGCIALAWNGGQRVSYWRQQREEVDVGSSGSRGHWAIDIKTGRVSTRDRAGLFAFTAQRGQYRPLPVCGSDEERAAHGAGIAASTWQQSRVGGPPV